MARKAIVDKEQILTLLKKGETTQQIAEYFHVSRQAIDLHRKDFINKGLLENRRAARKRVSRSIESPIDDTAINRQPELISRPFDNKIDTMSLNDQIDLLISAFSALKRIPQLERDLTTYKRENERISRELERLKNMESKRLEQENKWMLIRDDSIGESNN